MDEATMSFNERIELAFAKMGMREPFIAAVCGKLPKTIIENDPGFTASTNGEWIKFGKVWCEDEKFNNEELFGLALHEALHVVWMHMWRREGRHPGLWNIANDAIINATVKSRGYSLPKGGVMLGWVTPDMSSEDVYNRLMQEAQEQSQDGDGDGEGEGGEEGDGNGDGDEGNGDKKSQGKGGQGQRKSEKKFGKGGWQGKGDLEDAPSDANQANMEATIRAAAEMARACGDNSVILDRILGEPPKASVCWRDELRVALTSSARDDFTYRRFSRRFLGRGLHLPALHSDAMGGLMIGFDTSGSVSHEDAMQIAGEIQGIVEDLQPEFVEVIYCDAEISSTQRFERGDILRLKPTGGGGTRFKPVFDHVEKRVQEGERVSAMIYLTDMEGPMDELVEPQFPVVWGNVWGASNSEAPFGRVVRVQV